MRSLDARTQVNMGFAGEDRKGYDSHRHITLVCMQCPADPSFLEDLICPELHIMLSQLLKGACIPGNFSS